MNQLTEQSAIILDALIDESREVNWAEETDKAFDDMVLGFQRTGELVEKIKRESRGCLARNKKDVLGDTSLSTGKILMGEGFSVETDNIPESDEADRFENSVDSEQRLSNLRNDEALRAELSLTDNFD